MKSVYDLEIAANWIQDALIKEAQTERLLKQLPRRPTAVRTRLAVALYAAADWLSADVSDASRPRHLKTV